MPSCGFLRKLPLGLKSPTHCSLGSSVVLHTITWTLRALGLMPSLEVLLLAPTPALFLPPASPPLPTFQPHPTHDSAPSAVPTQLRFVLHFYSAHPQPLLHPLSQPS